MELISTERGKTMNEKPKVSEAIVLKSILEWLRVRGIFAWRNNTGAVKIDGPTRNRFVRYGTPGSSDILGCLPDGRFLAIECKSPIGRPTSDQLVFIKNIRDRGGIAFIARSIDDVIAELDDI